MPSHPDHAVSAPDPLIRKNRTADAALTVTANGVPLAGREVVVRQRNHKFLFGCIGFDFIPLANGELPAEPRSGQGGGPGSLGEAPTAQAEHLAELWFDLFNFATLPFYWGRFETVRGRPDSERLRSTAQWFADRGCVVKGHPLTWHTVTADWLTDLSNTDIARAQVDRIRRETTIVSGHIMPEEIVDLNDYQIPRWPTTPEGEARQADEVVRHYKTLLSHPSVRAMTYWGLADGGWLGAPGGFVRVDGTPKPSYEALHSLIKGEWWLAPTRMATNEEGLVRFNGFLGEYEVSAAGKTAVFRLDEPGEAAIKVAL